MFCPKCGVKNANGSQFCQKCGNQLNVQVVVDNGCILIPRNGAALASYYLGVFSLPFVILAIPSLICGIKGLSVAKKFPEKRGVTHSVTGIVLSIFSLVVWIALIVAVTR